MVSKKTHRMILTSTQRSRVQSFKKKNLSTNEMDEKIYKTYK
jgi:hypothetical protein